MAARSGRPPIRILPASHLTCTDLTEKDGAAQDLRIDPDLPASAAPHRPTARRTTTLPRRDALARPCHPVAQGSAGHSTQGRRQPDATAGRCETPERAATLGVFVLGLTFVLNVIPGEAAAMWVISPSTGARSRIAGVGSGRCGSLAAAAGREKSLRLATFKM
jgi:hypothetical protein